MKFKFKLHILCVNEAIFSLWFGNLIIWFCFSEDIMHKLYTMPDFATLKKIFVLLNDIWSDIHSILKRHIMCHSFSHKCCITPQ